MIKETFSPEETFAFGKWIGEKALPGQVYTLVGDLGVGKTVFTQGVAEGLGITEPVNSVKYSSPAPKIMSFGVRVVSAILISLLCFQNEKRG